MPNFFATCPRGLEKLLADELSGFSATDVQPTDGGVAFAGDWPTCYRANLQSRLASRILWRIKDATPFRNEQDVYKAVYDLPWTRWFDVDDTILVKVTAIKCPLKSLEFITLKIKDAVCDKFRAEKNARPSVAKLDPDMRIHAFFEGEKFTLYLDTSGDALYKRGVRIHTNIAPLRENLAAGILKMTGWKPGIPLLDPMCGAGTFLIEAAQISLNIQPGIARDFAFQKLKYFESAKWNEMREAAIAAQLPVRELPIYGSDLYGDALRAAHQNLEEAGIRETVDLKQCNALEASPPEKEGILVANLPIAKLMRLTPSKRTPLFNGAIECRLFEYKIVAGSNRPK